MTIEVLHKAKITITCQGCHSVLSADHDDFDYQHTNPPTWYLTCPQCNYRFKSSPSELITAVVANMHSHDVAMTMDRTIGHMTGRYGVGFLTKTMDVEANKKPRQFDHYGRQLE